MYVLHTCIHTDLGTITANARAECSDVIPEGGGEGAAAGKQRLCTGAHTHTHTLSLSLAHTLTHTHTHTHTLSLSLTHTHTHTNIHSHTHPVAADKQRLCTGAHTHT